MRKQFVLMVVAMVTFAMWCCGCGLQRGNTKTDTDGVGVSAEATVTECASEMDVPDFSIVDEDEADAAETASVEVFAQEDVAKEVTEEAETMSPETDDAGQRESEESAKQAGGNETSWETANPIMSEATSEPIAEESTESSTEQSPAAPTETSTEETSEDSPENSFVAYDPNYVVALATEKTKAYGKILVWENLDRMLAEGQITQEEYNEYYPYDGLEESYYSVFMETDLSKASTISGELLGTKDGIAEYIAGMLALETGPYFAISYAGIYEGTSGDFYEFRCHR